jgi:hypothetical protein
MDAGGSAPDASPSQELDQGEEKGLRLLRLVRERRKFQLSPAGQFRALLADWMPNGRH